VSSQQPEPLNLARNLRDPVTLVGAILSVAIGLAFYFKTDVPTALAAVAGMLGLVITLQLQLLVAMHQRDAADGRVARLLAATERLPWLADAIDDAVDRSTTIARSQMSEAVSLCQLTLETCNKNLADLQRGHYDEPYGEMRLFYKLTGTTQRAIRATSAQEVDLSWWETPRADRYWELQRAALARGVAIKRVFIYSHWTAGLEKLASTQAAAGVHVWTVRNEVLPPDLRIDMVVWDETCAYETAPNAVGEPVFNRFRLNAADVGQAIRRFESILANASVYERSNP